MIKKTAFNIFLCFILFIYLTIVSCCYSSSKSRLDSCFKKLDNIPGIDSYKKSNSDSYAILYVLNAQRCGEDEIKTRYSRWRMTNNMIDDNALEIDFKSHEMLKKKKEIAHECLENLIDRNISTIRPAVNCCVGEHSHFGSEFYKTAIIDKKKIYNECMDMFGVL